MLDTTPPELVAVAAEAGFRTIGIRLTATPSVGVPPDGMLREGPLRRETLRRLSDTGLSVLDTEFLRFEPEEDRGVRLVTPCSRRPTLPWSGQITATRGAARRVATRSPASRERRPRCATTGSRRTATST